MYSDRTNTNVYSTYVMCVNAIQSDIYYKGFSSNINELYTIIDTVPSISHWVIENVNFKVFGGY